MALLGRKAELAQAAERLLAGRGLLAAHDLAALIAEQILAGQAALGVVGRAVVDLGLAADAHHAAADRWITSAIRTRGRWRHNGFWVFVSVVHFLSEQQIFFRGCQWAGTGSPRRNHRPFQPRLNLFGDRTWI